LAALSSVPAKLRFLQNVQLKNGTGGHSKTAQPLSAGISSSERLNLPDTRRSAKKRKIVGVIRLATTFSLHYQPVSRGLKQFPTAFQQ
jgi:hypothetical protein